VLLPNKLELNASQKSSKKPFSRQRLQDEQTQKLEAEDDNGRI
jgi:hypothetical protein